MMMLGSYPWQTFPSFTHAAVDTMLNWTFGNNATFTKALMTHYPISMGSPFYRLSEAITDSTFKCSARRFANHVASRPSSPPVFLGETAFDPSAYNDSWSPTNMFNWFLGANHLQATSLVFGVPLDGKQGGFSPEHQAVSAQLNCHYAFFLHCGNPNVTESGECFKKLLKTKASLRSCVDSSNDRKVWEINFDPYDPVEPTKFQLMKEAAVLPFGKEETDRCNFWDAHPASEFRMVPNLCRGCNQTASGVSSDTSSAKSKQSK
jgi:hypothetical protein